jgi:hypothetical protein
MARRPAPGFFAPKLLVVQPRAHILFPSRIYPAKSFIGLNLVSVAG